MPTSGSPCARCFYRRSNVRIKCCVLLLLHVLCRTDDYTKEPSNSFALPSFRRLHSTASFRHTGRSGETHKDAACVEVGTHTEYRWNAAMKHSRNARLPDGRQNARSDA